MKQILSETEKSQLDQLIKKAEERINAQVVLAFIQRCDIYAEIPWKAFALSGSVMGLLMFLLNLLMPGWITNALILASIAAPLAVGAFFALATILLPGFARLFLPGSRAETETRQYAESLFYARELFATEGRNGLLLLVSRFERQIVILPDKALSHRFSNEAMQEIIALMSPHLRQKEVRRAMETGLEGLIKLLEGSATAAEVKDELSNEIIEEEGV